MASAQAAIQNTLRTSRSFFTSIALSQLVLLALPSFVPPTGTSEGLPPPILLAGLTALAALPARRAMLGTFGLAFSGGGAEALRAEQAEPLPEDEADEALRAALKRWIPGQLVGLVLAETTTLLGFVGTWMSGDWRYGAVCGGVGLALTLVQLPTEGGLASTLPPPLRARLAL